MRANQVDLAVKFAERLKEFEADQELPGIQSEAARGAFVERLIESLRRVRFFSVVSERTPSCLRADPANVIFDPLRAAVFHRERGARDEAFWMVFLFVHFGRHARGGYRYSRDVYGRLGDTPCWDWLETSADPVGFRVWLRQNANAIRESGEPGGFGNHRKRMTLDADHPAGTGAAFETYVDWVGHPRSHDAKFSGFAGDESSSFDYWYNDMEAVAGFGRTARFDYLTTVGNLSLLDIRPGRPYLAGATGPLVGARLLFGKNGVADLGPKDLEELIVKLDRHLQVGMQVLEDAICNWQKSPEEFKPFGG